MSEDYDKIEITDEKDRLFKAWGSVEIIDHDGDLIPMSAFAKIMPKLMERGAPLIDNHTNRVVGKILNYEFRKKGDKEGLLITGKVFDHFNQDDIVWNEIKSGKRRGISFGGKKIISSIKKVSDGENTYDILNDIEGYEFSIVSNPSNPEATIETINMIAKGEDVDKSAISALRNIEHGKKYGKPVHKEDENDHIGIYRSKDKWYVRDENTGNILGEHETKESAIEQLQAIYSNIEKKVEKTPDGKWAVVHCHGEDKGKPIKTFNTKEEAERMHRAIMANEGGKNMKKGEENETLDGAENTSDNDVDDKIANVLATLSEKLDAIIEAINGGIKKLDDYNAPKEEETKKEEEEETPKEDEEENEEKVQKSIDIDKIKEELKKSIIDELGINKVETERPPAPPQKTENPDRDLALKVARGEVNMTAHEIEMKRRRNYEEKLASILED